MTMKVLQIDEIVESENRYYRVRKEYDNTYGIYVKLVPCDMSNEEIILNKIDYIEKQLNNLREYLREENKA